MIPTGSNNYLGGQGSDIYIISPFALPAGVTARITDVEGTNAVQLVDGMTLASSLFYTDAAQLTLPNGAVIQILGASRFNFQVGANITAGDTAVNQTYSQFAVALGGSVPAAGAPAVSGTPNFVVPTGW